MSARYNVEKVSLSVLALQDAIDAHIDAIESAACDQIDEFIAGIFHDDNDQYQTLFLSTWFEDGKLSIHVCLDSGEVKKFSMEDAFFPMEDPELVEWADPETPRLIAAELRALADSIEQTGIASK